MTGLGSGQLRAQELTATVEGEGSQEPVEQSAPERPALDPRRSQLQALRLELPATQQLGLPLGEQEFYALYQAHQTARPLGGVVLLHDEGQHGDWPRLTRPLRLGLAQHGWATLSLNLQELPARALPPRVLPDKGELYYPGGEADSQESAAANDEAAEPDSEVGLRREMAEGDAMIQLQEVPPPSVVRTPMMVFEEQALRRLGAGIAYLRQVVGDELVVVGIGASARLTALHLAQYPEQGAGQGLTLVWISPRLTPEEQADLSRLFGKPPYPRLLEVVDRSDPQQVALARERLGSARRLGMEQYEQVRLPLLLNGSAQQDQALVQRLHTWLKARLESPASPTED